MAVSHADICFWEGKVKNCSY